MRRERFAPNGMLALAPKAFGETFDTYEPAGAAEPSAVVCVVSVRGPLMFHEQFMFDSYEAIKERVAMALRSSASCVMLDIDSPGGLVAGCFDTAREIRKMADAAGKPLYAFTTNATSAAYALACAADKIFTSESGRLGSIGVIETLVDATAQDAAVGLRFELVTSGARKADGNPHSELTSGTLAAAQHSVDSAAALFYAYVAERRDITPEAIRALDAGIFLGREAVGLRLADSLATLESAVEIVSAPGYAAQIESDNDMAQGTVSAAIEALTKAAESDDKDERANARRMLAKYYAEDVKAEDGDDDSEKKDDGEKKAESEKKDEPVKDDDKKEAKAFDAGAEALAVAREAKALAESTERARLIDSRPDLAPEVATALAGGTLEFVRSFLKGVPVGKVPAKSSTVRDAVAAATSTAAATRGDASAATQSYEQLDSHGQQHTYTTRDLDRQMGLALANFDPITVGNNVGFATLTPEQARAKLAAKSKEIVK